MGRCTQVRAGAYFDSVVLMQLQRALAALPGVEEAGVVMGTPANKEILAQSGLLDDVGARAGAEDLILSVRADSDRAADAALAQVDALIASRRSTETGDGYRPRTLESAARLLPEAQWVLVSTPGRHAAGVAREALRLGKHVFLYSDNVPLAEEVSLKSEAAERGLLVMGPDCGTAIVGGIGLGFANRVRRGPIGIVGASGTGLQHVASRIHQLGSGITHAIGTGGRDLSEAVAAATAIQALDLLRRDPATSVIVLISKPPAPSVADRLLRAARACGKPVVIDFLGYDGSTDDDSIVFAHTLDEAASLAVELAAIVAEETTPARPVGHGYLRGLFSGGTLAYEAQIVLRDRLGDIWSNAPLDKRLKLESGLTSRCHTIIDLGEDEFTVGRLHPMLDNDLRIRRMMQEAANPETGALLLDVVLGDGAHPDPSADLVPAIERARAIAIESGRDLPVIVLLVGTDADPQGLDAQAETLRSAGAQVFFGASHAFVAAADSVRSSTEVLTPVSLDTLTRPLAALNVGLESFAASLTAQGARAVHVDWRPPAGGDERLAGILAKMKRA